MKSALKNSGFLAIFLACTLVINAQNNNYGIMLLKMCQWKKAKSVLQMQLKLNTNDYMALYSMGEYYYATGDLDSANIFYEKSMAANPKYPSNYLGLAKVHACKGNSVKVFDDIETAKKLGKKNAALIVEIARIYSMPELKKYEDAKSMLLLAKSIETNCSDIYIFEGKIALENKDYSTAASKFDQAIYFDSTQFEAYIMIARIYASATNINSAIAYLDKLLLKVPTCIIAYREKGDIYYNKGKYTEARKEYEKYINSAEYSPDEIEKYAYLLFFTKEYDKAQAIIKELSNNDPNNHIMLRLLSYMHFDKGEFERGIETFKKFFERIPAKNILALDYEYYAKTLEKAGADSLAIIQYQNLLNKDTTRTGLYEDIGKLYIKRRKFMDAANYFKQSIAHKQNPLASDYFQYARPYYFAAISLESESDSALKRQYLNIADSLFNIVTIMSPVSYLGYFWRARTNSMLDPETTEGKAKPYYEKALEFFNANPSKFQKELIEVYSYLGFYHFVKKEITASKNYWEKILEMDPANEKAQKALQGLSKS
jgi:tetratricopeptide (TPR) repeat protein